jgi:L-rhamnose mutarotase
MKLLIAFTLVFLAGAVYAQSKDTRYYELRIYYAASGKLDALVTRFSDHTTKLFDKHGMQNVGYWVPVNNDKNALYYVLSYPDKDSRKKSWDAFGADPEWKKVKDASETNGKLVDSVKQVFMYGADILPAINDKAAKAERTFELRTYHPYPGRRPALIKRFQDHTVKLFEKHGMQNIAYFTDENSEDLVYLIAHQSVDAAGKSWAAFIADPVWVKAAEDSQKDGKIVDRPRIESTFLKPLPFSKIK